jgi:hypothetical protein
VLGCCPLEIRLVALLPNAGLDREADKGEQTRTEDHTKAA